MSAIGCDNHVFVEAKKSDIHSRHIFSLVNLLFGMTEIKSKYGRQITQTILQEIIHSLQKIFTSQEIMMYESGYPDIAIHMGEHFKISQHLADTADQLNEGQKQITDLFCIALRICLANHLGEMDTCFDCYIVQWEPFEAKRAVLSQKYSSVAQLAAEFINTD